MLTIIGVYLPSSDKGIDCYRKHHLELEKIISGSSLVGTVIVLGDFIAQLGCLRGVRGTGDMNVQGVMVNDVFGRCNLNAISLVVLLIDRTTPMRALINRQQLTTYLLMKRLPRCLASNNYDCVEG